jgi:hypothetical protein
MGVTDPTGLLDAAEECAAGQFMMDDVVCAAVENAREAKDDYGRGVIENKISTDVEYTPPHPRL